MFRKLIGACVGLAMMGMVGTANAVLLSATVEFTGEFLRSSTVTNGSDPGINITNFVYTFGTPEDGVATWDGTDGVIPNIPDGGIASDFLSNPEFFQTLTFNVLIAPGDAFSEGNPLPQAAPPSFNDLDPVLEVGPLELVAVAA